jgi:hypothetical protein
VRGGRSLGQTARRPRPRPTPPGGRVRNGRLPPAARTLWRAAAPTKKGSGSWWARRLSAPRARQEERQRRLADTSRVRSFRVRRGGTRGTDPPRGVAGPPLCHFPA